MRRRERGGRRVCVCVFVRRRRRARCKVRVGWETMQKKEKRERSRCSFFFRPVGRVCFSTHRRTCTTQLALLPTALRPARCACITQDNTRTPPPMVRARGGAARRAPGPHPKNNIGHGEKKLTLASSPPPRPQPRNLALAAAALALAAAVALAPAATASVLPNGVLTANDAAGATHAAVAGANPARRPAPKTLSTAGLTTGPDGTPRFLFGYNMGNVRFIPFSKAPLSQTPDQLKALLTHAFEDMAATGARKGRGRWRERERKGETCGGGRRRRRRAIFWLPASGGSRSWALLGNRLQFQETMQGRPGIPEGEAGGWGLVGDCGRSRLPGQSLPAQTAAGRAGGAGGGGAPTSPHHLFFFFSTRQAATPSASGSTSTGPPPPNSTRPPGWCPAFRRRRWPT